jgi:DNA polymerase V
VSRGYDQWAAAKLRSGQQYAGELMVFIRTNPFRVGVLQYSKCASVRLVNATQDPRVIVQQTLVQLRSMYRAGYDYAKAGIVRSESMDKTGLQRDMFGRPSIHESNSERSLRLMAVMDEINCKSRATICMAREAGPAAYAMRREHLSQAYTASWSELPEVR